MIHLLRADMASLTKCFPFARIIFNIMQCPAQILTFYKFVQTVEVVEENECFWLAEPLTQ